MERTFAQSGVIGPVFEDADLVFAVAGHADDADIRRLLRENATSGWISLSLEREPNAFAAAAAIGRDHVYLIARERRTGAPVGLAEYSVHDAFIDGEVRALPYLASLRIVPHYRHRIRVLRGGFAAIRRLHEGGALPYALSAIAAENATALRLLGAGLPGLPCYRPFAPFSTFALRPYRAEPSAVAIEPATKADLPAIAVRLERSYRRFQFAPVWRARWLEQLARANLRPEDFLIVRRGPGIGACLALWDQNGFKQTVVRRYARPLAALRPAVNLAAAMLRMPRLPPVGAPLRQVYLSHVAVADDDPALFRALIAAGLAEAHRRGFALALIGLAARRPLAAVLAQEWRPREYRSLLHVVHWDNGRAAAAAIEPRLPHVEIAML